jgi:hypothetical protein
VQNERDTTRGQDLGPLRRPRLGALLLLVLGLLVLGGVGWYLLRGRGHRVLPMLTDLGVWAAIRAARRWSGRDLREWLEQGRRMLVDASGQAARRLAR